MRGWLHNRKIDQVKNYFKDNVIRGLLSYEGITNTEKEKLKTSMALDFS